MYTAHPFERTQVIYLASEIGRAGPVTSLALEVTRIPGKPLDHWTIRMKHTSLSSYANLAWEGSGWTIVYQRDTAPPAYAMWQTFEFKVPCDYDGVSNLMVDFSFDNSSASTTGLVEVSHPGGDRTAHGGSNSAYGDPLTWSETTGPTPSASTAVPNVRLRVWPIPRVTSITPNSGTNDGIVEITDLAGTGFLFIAKVALRKTGQADIVATQVMVVNSTKIMGIFNLAGAATGAWSVVVTNTNGVSGTLASGFEVKNPAPTVTSITPNSGTNNGTVNITDLAGTGFLSGATVKLSKAEAHIDATNVIVVSATKVTCTFNLAGAAVGVWDVVVTNADGQSGTLAGGCTVKNPPPTVTSITPNSGTNDGGVGITNLAGTGFLPGATVKLRKTGQADIAATNVTVAATKITGTLNLAGAVAGAWDVVVTNADGQSGTLAGGFTVSNAPPKIISIDPHYGLNNGSVAITNLAGTGFLPGATVKLRKTGQTDIVATYVVVLSSTTITCTFSLAGAATGAWEVVVTNYDGKLATLPGGFTVRLAGDVNQDNKVDVFDLAGAGQAFNTKQGDANYSSDADLNQDGIVDIVDLVQIAVNLGKTLNP